MHLVTPMRFFPLQDIAECWRTLAELLPDPTWANQPPYYFTEKVLSSGWQPGPIQPVWWHQQWIPIASDQAGNLTCLDLAPTPSGTVGQIIDWDHECGPSRILYPSFAHLLAALADQVENRNAPATE